MVSPTWLRHPAWLPVPVFVVLLSLALPVDSRWESFSALPLLVLNTAFLTVTGLAVAVLAALAYLRAGYGSVLALGCAALAVAGSGVPPGILSFTSGPPAAVAMHNCAVALAGLANLGSVLSAIRITPPRRPAARRWLTLGCFGAVVAGLALVYGLEAGGAMPAFVVGGAFTALRQSVLGAAAALFGLCTVFWAVSWMHVRARFLSWYALALALYTLGLVAVLVQHEVGSPVGWVGRGAQYLAGVYLIVAVLRAREQGLAAAMTNSTLPYRSMVESANDPVIGIDRRGGILYWNPAARARFGYDPNAAHGVDLVDCLAAPGGRAELRSALRTCQAGGGRVHVEVSLSDRDAADFLAEVTLYAVDERPGRLIMCLVRDLSERERSRLALQRSVALLESQQELSPDGIVVVDEQDSILSVNQRFLQMWSLPPDPLDRGEGGALLRAALRQVTDPAGFQARIAAIYADRTRRCSDEIDLVDGRVFERVTAPSGAPDGGYLGRVWFFRDVSARMQVERELRALASELDQAQRVAGMGSIRIDLDTRLQHWSAGMFRLTGMPQTPRGEVGEARARAMLHPTDGDAVYVAIDTCIRTGRPFDLDGRIVHADGRIRWVHSRGELVPAGNGRPAQLVGSVQDVTERHRAEEQLRYERDLNTGILDVAGALILVMDADWRIVRFNRQAELLTGCREADVVGRHYRFLIPSEEFVDVDTALQPVSPDHPVSQVNHLVARDGQLRLIRWSNTGLLDTDGRHTHLIAVGVDITEQQQAEDELRRTTALLQCTQEISSTGGWEYDVASHRTMWTDEVYQIYGVNKTFDLTDSSASLAAYDELSALVIEAAFTQLITAGVPYDLELGFVRADGQHIWVRTIGRPVYEDGRIVRAVGNISDVTQRLRAQDEVLRLNAELEHRVRRRTAELERSNRELESFAYTTSHDLRTPLRAISGFAEILLGKYGDVLDENGRDYAYRICVAGQKMARLIDDLLRLSHLARAELCLSTVDLSAMAREIVAGLRASAPQRHVTVTVADGVTARADPELIRTVLENLLGNAWKFTADREHAHIEFTTLPSPPSGPVTCCVRDDGIGFDPAYADKLFQPFQRLHAVTDLPGSGVGLASVRHIIELHNGHAWAEGEPDRGAMFAFTLPGDG